MSLNIPSKKADVLIDYHGHGNRGQERPALNVKHYGDVEYTAERIAEHFGCDAATAERAAGWCYESAREQFWEQALDSLNYAFCGGKEYDGRYKPSGLQDGPYKIWAEGRSGGWLVAEGLPDVSTWDAATLQKWRRFARTIQQEMEYLASWDYGREMIEANEWAPKSGTVEANRENARTAPTDRLAKAAFEIHGELDGKVWSPDTLNRIADHLRAAGLVVALYEDAANDD